MLSYDQHTMLFQQQIYDLPLIKNHTGRLTTYQLMLTCALHDYKRVLRRLTQVNINYPIEYPQQELRAARCTRPRIMPGLNIIITRTDGLEK